MQHLWPEHEPTIVAGYDAIPGLGPTMLFPVSFDPDIRIEELHDTLGIIAYDDYHCVEPGCDCFQFFLEVWRGGHALLSGAEPQLVIYLVGELRTQRLRFVAGVSPTPEAEALRAELEDVFWPETWELMNERRNQVRSWSSALVLMH